MSWRDLVADGRVVTHVTSRREIEDLRAIVARNLADASTKAISADNRFGLAYEAALILAKMAIAAAGYRVKGASAHQTTFEALEFAMGPPVRAFAGYIDRCRRQRNTLSYDAAGIVSDADAEDLLKQARIFNTTVESWLKRNYPPLAK